MAHRDLGIEKEMEIVGAELIPKRNSVVIGYLNVRQNVQLCSNILPSSVVGHFSSLLPTLSYYRPQRS